MMSKRQRGPNSAQGVAVEAERFAAPRGFDAHCAGRKGQRSRDEFVARGACQHFVDPGHALQRLLHQPQVAAARQAEAGRLFLGHAIGDERRFGHAFTVAQPVDEVVFDAAP